MGSNPTEQFRGETKKANTGKKKGSNPVERGAGKVKQRGNKRSYLRGREFVF